jgi:phage-related protein
MANTITIDILADTRKLVQGVNTANQQLSGLQRSISKVGNITAAAGAFAIAGQGFADLGRFATDAVKSSIALADSVDAVKMTLKDDKAFANFQTFLKTTSTTLGLSQKNAAGFGAQLAGIGSGAGLGGQELEKFTERSLQLAVDLRSKFGGGIEEALTAVKSALTGELTPLKKYGVALSDATMKQYGLEKGLIKTTKGALTPQQKTMIAYQMLLDGKVNGSVGNFADTQGSAANQLEQLNAQLDDAKTTLGNAFLPGLTKVVTFINEKVIPAFKDLPGPIKVFIGVAAGLGIIAAPVVLAAAAFGALGISVGALATAVWAVLAPVLIVIAVIAALAALGYLIYKNWDNITKFFGDAWDKIVEIWKGLPEFFGGLFSGAWEKVKEFWGWFTGWLEDVKNWLGDKFATAWNFIVNVFKTVFDKAWTFFKEFPGKVIKWLKELPGKIKAKAEDFMNIGESIVKGIWRGITAMASWLKEKVTGFFGNVSGWAKKVLGIKSPSRVFLEFGEQIVKGLAIGMNPNGIKSASSGLAMGAMSGFGPAQLAGTGGMRGGIVVNINAGLGTDPYELGRVVSQALNKYESINGTR